MKYDTNEEAIAKAEEINKNITDYISENMFCPLLSGPCNQKCICFNKARGLNGYLYMPYCHNQMFADVMSCEAQIQGNVNC